MKILRNILLLLATIAVIFEWYFGIASLIWFSIQVILLAIIVSVFLYILSPRTQKNYKHIFLSTSLVFMAVVWLFIAIVSGFVIYQNTHPAILSDITLSDWESTVVFVSMSHIATPQFFHNKNRQLQALANSGYVLLMEWVQKGTIESHTKFDSYMGFRFTDTLYKTISDITGLEAQDNSRLYAHISTGSIVSVDLSMDTIVEHIVNTDSMTWWTTISAEILDIETELSWAVDTLSPRDKKLFGSIFRALANSVLRSSNDFQSHIMAWERAAVFHAILDKRNEPVVEYIRTHPWQKIAIVYGSLHFNGIYAWLQQISQDWKIQSFAHNMPYR
jgi:hypothetical protein